MNVLLLYFSGTGNTDFVARKIHDELIKKNHTVCRSPVESFPPENSCKYDVLILGYPVYACSMPEFMQSYVSRIKAPSTKAVIVFSTMGFYGGNSLRNSGIRLINSGLIPLLFEEIKMPGSDGMVFMSKNSKYAVKALSTNYNESGHIIKAVNNIISCIEAIGNNRDICTEPKLPRVKLSGIVIEALLAKVYSFVDKKLKCKFRADSRCVGCHRCENICPSHNIIVKDKKVVFLDKCYLCMRCINQCPAEAIQIGTKTNGKFRWKGPLGDYHPDSSNR